MWAPLSVTILRAIIAARRGRCHESFAPCGARLRRLIGGRSILEVRQRSFLRMEQMMATTLTRDDLLKAVKRMKRDEFEEFLQEAFSLRTKDHALSEHETALLLKINEGLPEGLRQRYADLRARDARESLSANERQELLRLTDEIELHDARRVEALAELAQLRGVPIRTLMKQLGIKAQPI